MHHWRDSNAHVPIGPTMPSRRRPVERRVSGPFRTWTLAKVDGLIVAGRRKGGAPPRRMPVFVFIYHQDCAPAMNNNKLPRRAKQSFRPTKPLRKPQDSACR
jgi:hypothetical protein